MEGNTNWKPNEQGGDAGANNANDWRSQLVPQFRNRVLSKIVEKLKECFPREDEDKIKDIAVKFEKNTYGIAKDKDDYIRKLSEKMHRLEKTYKKAPLGSSSVSGTNTQDPAQVMNQSQSVPTSLPYTQTPTSQQWLPQKKQRNLNIPGSSGLPNQVPINVSVSQNVNIQMGEGVHMNILPGSQIRVQGRKQLIPQQQQPQEHQMNKQVLKEKMQHGNLRQPHMQQQAQPLQQQHHPQSLLKQPIQQSLPQSSALSSLQSSGQQNSQPLQRHQFSTHRVPSSHQQQMVVPSQEQKQQEQEQEQLISQLMNVPNMQQNHPTSRQHNREQQGAFRVSPSQKNNMASFQSMAQQNNNLQHMHPQRLNNDSPLPSQQQQSMLGAQSCNFNASRSSLLHTQGQEVRQSQPVMLQQYPPQYPVQQQPQNRSVHQHLKSVQINTQRFHQAGSSLRQTQNISDQRNQPHQLQRAPMANPSTSQDSTGKTVNVTGGDWQEETYQKIKALKEMYLPVLSTILQRIKEKLRQIESLPPQNMLSGPTEKLKDFKLSLEQTMVYLNVHRSNISEKHRDRFPLFEQNILKFTKSKNIPHRPMQQQQGQFQPSQNHQTPLQSQSPQVHESQSLEKDQTNSRLMSSSQNGASSSISGLMTSQTTMSHSLQKSSKLEPRYENNIMVSSGNVMLPSLKQSPASNPQAVNSNISSVQSQQKKHFHHRQMQQPLLHRQQQQQLQQPRQDNPQLQMPTSQQTNEINDVKMRQQVNIKAEMFQKHLSSSQRQLLKPMSKVSSPSASSPQMHDHSSPQPVDQQIIPTVNKTGTPSMSDGSPFVDPSPIPGDPEMPISVESPVSQEHPLSTPPPPPPESITERPIDRLIKAFQSASPKSLAESVSEMSSVISMVDMIAGSFHPDGGSRACLREDLSERTKFRFQSRHLMRQGDTNPSKIMKRSIIALPRDIASDIDCSYNEFSNLESEVDSTASSGSKFNMIEPHCSLLQEIKEINGRLIETVVEICNEDTSGTIVTCSYSPVALSATFKDHYNSGQISQIQPLRLLVPDNYPYSSPILLEEISETSVHKYEDLSARTRSRFSLSLKELSEPGSLKEIAQKWNDCARATMMEYAERHGGGTFSSKYGGWETVLRAS